jgi:hypothetical protein
MYSPDVCSKSDPMEQSDTTELEGVIMKMAQVNPPGSKMATSSDFYIQGGLKSYFIKICESKLNKKQLNELVGSQVKAHISLRDGFWDICGDALVQSRTGPYVALDAVEILKDKKTYHYYDGNSNHYTITAGMIKYDPVKKENSSSGAYSGGKPARAALSEEQFESLVKLISSIEKDPAIRASTRAKGTGMVSITFSQELRKFIFLKGTKMNQLEKELKSALSL